MRPSCEQLLQRHARDLAPHAVEARQHDGVRRVVDDEVDAGEVLERADVAPLAADDAALHVVGRELDDGDGRLRGVAGRRAAASRPRGCSARAAPPRAWSPPRSGADPRRSWRASSSTSLSSSCLRLPGAQPGRRARAAASCCAASSPLRAACSRSQRPLAVVELRRARVEVLRSLVQRALQRCGTCSSRRRSSASTRVERRAPRSRALGRSAAAGVAALGGRAAAARDEAPLPARRRDHDSIAVPLPQPGRRGRRPVASAMSARSGRARRPISDARAAGRRPSVRLRRCRVVPPAGTLARRRLPVTGRVVVRFTCESGLRCLLVFRPDRGPVVRCAGIVVPRAALAQAGVAVLACRSAARVARTASYASSSVVPAAHEHAERALALARRSPAAREAPRAAPPAPPRARPACSRARAPPRSRAPGTPSSASRRSMRSLAPPVQPPPVLGEQPRVARVVDVALRSQLGQRRVDRRGSTSLALELAPRTSAPCGRAAPR